MDVIAIGGVQIDFRRDDLVVVRAHRDHQRIAAGPALDMSRNHFRSGQPSTDIDLMHEGIRHRHGSGKPLGRARIAVHVVQQHDGADFPFVPQAFHLLITGIEAAHVADLDKAAFQGDFSLNHAKRIGGRGRQRLLAKHRFSSVQAGQRQLGMGCVRRSKDHGADAVRCNQGSGVGKHGGARRGAMSAPGVGVKDARQMRPGRPSAEKARMFGPHHACSNDTDAEGHAFAPFGNRGLRATSPSAGQDQPDPSKGGDAVWSAARLRFDDRLLDHGTMQNPWISGTVLARPRRRENPGPVDRASIRPPAWPPASARRHSRHRQTDRRE